MPKKITRWIFDKDEEYSWMGKEFQKPVKIPEETEEDKIEYAEGAKALKEGLKDVKYVFAPSIDDKIEKLKKSIAQEKRFNEVVSLEKQLAELKAKNKELAKPKFKLPFFDKKKEKKDSADWE